MARLRRLSPPGFPLHVVVRGNDRNDIFRTPGDRIYFHRCLVETTRRHGVSIHAYVLMSNHVHLLATGPGRAAVARVIQSMGRRYVSYFNYLYQRTGTLWEGRYKSAVIETDRYLFACHRYMELNPVRAGIVSFPDDFIWSSHLANAAGEADDLVTPHPLYLSLGADEATRRIAYRRLFECPLGDDDLRAIRDSINKGWALGGPAFCAAVEGLEGRRALPSIRGRRSRKVAATPAMAELT